MNDSQTNVSLPDQWLVIGCNSLVGSRFIEIVGSTSVLYGVGGGEINPDPNIKMYNKIDITNAKEVYEAIGAFPGRYVINFAGATAVDDIEKSRPIDISNIEELNRNSAYQINVVGTKNIIAACKNFDKFPVFISTGFVFDGKNGPYKEEDSISSDPDSVGWYAWTKILAEKEIIDSKIPFLIIRIGYPYRKEFSGKSDFARSFIKLYDDVKSGVKEKFYPIFIDQTLTPTFIDDLPGAVLRLIQSGSQGIYHVASPDVTTPYEFCCEVLKVAKGVKNPEEIVPKGSMVEFEKTHPDSAKRPLHGGELPDKIIKLGLTPTSWKEGISKAFGK